MIRKAPARFTHCGSRRQLLSISLCIILSSTASLSQTADVAALAARAAGGDLDAVYALGMTRELGLDGSSDPVEAAQLYARAASKGHAAAQSRLGYLYQTGVGVTRDPVRAFTLYSEAAAAGDVQGQFLLAVAFVNGVGTAADLPAARRWLARAAGAGHQQSQIMLALALQGGAGGPVNKLAARRWFQQAVSGPDPAIAEKAKGLRDKIDDEVLSRGSFDGDFLVALLAFGFGAALLFSGSSDSRSSQDPYRYDRSFMNNELKRNSCHLQALNGSKDDYWLNFTRCMSF